jgi:hypothetical protein
LKEACAGFIRDEDCVDVITAGVLE